MITMEELIPPAPTLYKNLSRSTFGTHNRKQQQQQQQQHPTSKRIQRQPDETTIERKKLKKLVISRRWQDCFLLLICLLLALSWVISNALPTAIRTASNLRKQQTTPSYPYPLIHIINTRFMQDQSNLPTLAQARLQLFQTFCLPSMISQSSQQFIWIIKTDPNLDPDLRNQMIQLLKPHANFYLVGSNTNYLIGHEKGAWRGGVEGTDVFKSHIYTGDLELLKAAHLENESKIVLQTRLDADDGLHKDYVRYIQHQAMETFLDDDAEETTTGDHQNNNNTPNWYYWCTRRAIEWFANQETPNGRVKYVKHSKLCITPGITVGFNIGMSEQSVPQYAHDKLFKSLEKEGGCGMEDDDDYCIAMVEAFPFGAMRSRTPTSAGMMDVELNEENDPVEKLWKLLKTDFMIREDMAKKVNRYIQENMLGIAIDNLKGQCTHGHSCKLSSKDKLLRLIELEGEKERGVEII